MKNLIATRKDDNWNDGTTTIWFEDISTNDGEIYGVVFEGNSDPVLVDCEGSPAEGQHDAVGVLDKLIDLARAAVVNL